MGLKIVKGGDSWELPNNFHLTDAGFEKRMELTERAFSDGGINKGDDMIDIRSLKLEGELLANSDGEYDSKWNELILKMTQVEFYLEDGSWQILIAGAKRIDQTFDKSLRKRLGQIEIELVASDPFWEHKDLSTKEESCPAPPEEFVVTNDGSYVAYPVITITANANNPNMTLKNITDNNAIFSYIDSGFLITKVLVVDCKKGTVKLDGTNTIRYFAGQFLRLLPGNNTIRYEGANATVKFEFYRRKL